jgi:hypothetical protein
MTSLPRAASALLLATAALVLVPTAPAPAAQSSSVTGLEVQYDYRLADALEGCTKRSASNISLSAPGQGPAFADVEYQDGWVVTLDLSSTDGTVLGTVSTTEAYTSTYDGKSLELTLRCAAVRTLVESGYGAGGEVRLSITSAVFDDGAVTLDTTAGSVDLTPKQVVGLEPLTARRKSGGSYRITTRVRLWSPVETGFGWVEPGRPVEVTGLWKSCPFRTVSSADDGRFTVTWRAGALLKGRNFGYWVPETRSHGSIDRGWSIEDTTTFRRTESYPNGCGGA